MEGILREILAKDKSILSRRDDLLAALDKKVPGNLSRDYTPIKRAINLNIGEMFFVGESDKETTKAKIAETLKGKGMQEARINFVIETFEKALGWDKIPKVEKVTETFTKTEINTVKPSAKVSLIKKEKPPKVEELPKVEEPLEIEKSTQILVPKKPTENIIEQTSQHFDELQKSAPKESKPPKNDSAPLPQNDKSKIFTTEGRLNRWAYFVQSLKVIGIVLVGSLLSQIYIGIPILIAAVVGGIMVNIRRLHDLNKSGWWLLVSLIPYVNVVFSFYMLFAKGTDGYNKYGFDPLRE